MPGVFLVLEGIGGSGKSYQARRCAELLRSLGHDVVLTREPGGTELGTAISKLVLDPRYHGYIDAIANMELMMIARRAHVDEVIRPALAAGRIVVCDRYVHSTVAYQCYGQFLPIEQVMDRFRAAAGGLMPHRAFLVDISLEEMAIRLGKAHRSESDKFDAISTDFDSRVHQGYQDMTTWANSPLRLFAVDGYGTPDEVTDRLLGEMLGVVYEAQAKEGK
jgi:dTMP kinase